MNLGRSAGLQQAGGEGGESQPGASIGFDNKCVYRQTTLGCNTTGAASTVCVSSFVRSLQLPSLPSCLLADCLPACLPDSRSVRALSRNPTPTLHPSVCVNFLHLAWASQERLIDIHRHMHGRRGSVQGGQGSQSCFSLPRCACCREQKR